ncbi:MAG: DNA repair protein RecO [Abditibacteriota bacterium]|nr:DNA repair protein RecO [Abditibacteriota bacterium]
MRNIKLTTITLKKRDFKEKDRILTVLSRELGKYDFIAKGIQKPVTKLSGISEPMSYGTLIVSQLKNLGTISSCNIIETFTEIHNNLNTLSHALYLLELADKCTAYENPQDEIFDILLASLYMFEAGTDPEIATRYFEHKIINALGYNINTDKCIRCGDVLKDKIYYNVDFGGFLCENCNKIISNNLTFPFALISYMNAFDDNPVQKIKNFSFPENVNNALSLLYKRHLAYRIEKNINSIDFILKQKNLTRIKNDKQR